MQRLLACLALTLFLSSASVDAQTVRPKAYAPENLSELNEQDQARVIRYEYEDQSGGRQIPDDQLEFYIDQVDSGWTFSRIKEDIARSLRGDRPGNGGGYWNDDRNGPPYGNAYGRTIRCQSVEGRPSECETNFRNRAVVHRNLSRTQCVEGRNWGQRPGVIWVNRGCRAEFIEVRDNGGWDNSDYSRYTVTCVSRDEGYATCAWNSRYGRPMLIERTSRADCIEGRSWGYRNGTLWVDRGCRARFGTDGDWNRRRR